MFWNLQTFMKTWHLHLEPSFRSLIMAQKIFLIKDFPMTEEVKEKKAKKKGDNAKIGAVIVLVISALVFIPTGGSAVIQSIMQKKNTRVFGKYKGNKIEYKAGSDFTQNVTNIANYYQAMGYDVNQIYSYVFQEAYETTVQDLYYTDAVESSKYSVPKGAINRLILPNFRDENGEYSQKIFNQTDEATKAELRTAAEKNLIRSRYSDDMLGSGNLYGLKISSKEENFVASMGTEKHAFQIAAFSTNDLPAEEVTKYAKSNMDTFRKYNLSAITLTEKLDADNTLKQIQNGELTFEQAITDISERLYTESDGKVSTSYYYQLKNMIPDETDLATVTGLSVGGTTGVIQTSRGYTIFRCDGNYTDADLTNEDTVDAVLSYIKSYEVSYIEKYYTEIAEKFVYEASSLKSVIMDISDGEEGRILNPEVRADKRLIDQGGENIVEFNPFELACKNKGLSAVNVSAFPINYGDAAFFDRTPSDISELAGLATNAAALKAMFSLKENEIGTPFVLGSNVIVAKCVSIQKDDITEDGDYKNQAEYYNSSSSREAIMASPDLEDRFTEAFYSSFLN